MRLGIIPGWLGLKLVSTRTLNMPGPGPLFKMEENADPPLPHDAVSLSSSLNQLTVLVRSLEEIFRSIEPTQANMHVYGHLIRNTLLLAAMEFENECKGVLNAHGYIPASTSGRWSTVDFIKVLGPLRLQQFEVNLSFYPAIASRKPFQGWMLRLLHSPCHGMTPIMQSNTTGNASFNVRRESAIDAVSACAIMLAAEYRAVWSWKDQIGGFFSFIKSRMEAGTKICLLSQCWTMAEHSFLLLNPAGQFARGELARRIVPSVSAFRARNRPSEAAAKSPLGSRATDLRCPREVRFSSGSDRIAALRQPTPTDYISSGLHPDASGRKREGRGLRRSGRLLHRRSAASRALRSMHCGEWFDANDDLLSEMEKAHVGKLTVCQLHSKTSRRN